MAPDDANKSDSAQGKAPAKAAPAPAKLEGEDTQRKPRRNTTQQLGRSSDKARPGVGDRRKR